MHFDDTPPVRTKTVAKAEDPIEALIEEKMARAQIKNPELKKFLHTAFVHVALAASQQGVVKGASEATAAGLSKAAQDQMAEGIGKGLAAVKDEILKAIDGLKPDRAELAAQREELDRLKKSAFVPMPVRSHRLVAEADVSGERAAELHALELCLAAASDPAAKVALKQQIELRK